MLDIETLAREIVAREGGYVNDPDDPGGATKHGVTIGTMRRLGMDLDGDGQVDAGDVQVLDRDQAVEIFLEYYYARPRVSALPEAVQPSVFDMYVNSGANAVWILQQLLNEMGETLKVDGIIGAKTIKAAKAVYQRAPDHLADAYGIARRNYYYALADRRASSRKYARTRSGAKGGWIKRAEEFISPKYHLTEAEHTARIAAWG